MSGQYYIRHNGIGFIRLSLITERKTSGGVLDMKKNHKIQNEELLFRTHAHVSSFYSPLTYLQLKSETTPRK